MLNYKSKLKCVFGAAAAIAVLSLASAAGAVTLSTGAGPVGAAEPNWTLTVSPGSTSLTIVSGAQDYPGAWVTAPSAGSNWITPYASGGTTATDAPLGAYEYHSFTFGNPGGPVTIQWSSDNGAQFFLNDGAIPLSTVGPAGFGSLVLFVIPAAAFGASNEFEVLVQNDPCGGCLNPTGLLVSTDADVSPVPLPAALPLFASGVGALGLLGWRRKKRKPVPLAA
jgi:hypothetical protein